MLLILANSWDQTAEALAMRWAGDGACLLKPADLSRLGWRHYAGDLNNSTAGVGADAIKVRDISGVLTRLQVVSEYDLAHIEPADRSYAASEMTAFLLAWLSSLQCKVINRPTPYGLAGPNWRREQWIHLAAKLSIPVAPVRRKIMLQPGQETGQMVTHSAAVTLVGDRCFGDTCRGARGNEIAKRARRLAQAAEVDLLEVELSNDEPEALLLNAGVSPAGISDESADAILALLKRQ